jgi:hypothetical protein
MKAKLTFLLTILGLICYANAAIINVPGNYPTIQGAINAAQNHDTILVEPGTYFENINFRGKNIVVTSRYYLTNNPATIYATVINGSTPPNPDSGSCVTLINVDSTAVLQGFAITGGTGTKWLDEYGAGLYREGGGILMQYSSPVIQNNIIFNNQVNNISGVTSTGGGGMRIGDGYPRIFNNVIMNNSARYGAGIVLNYTGGELYNNIICVNYGSFQYGAGSGIWVNGTFTRPRTIVNNTIVNNSATNGTAGVYSGGLAAATMINSIVWGNTSPGGAQILGGSAFFARYCDVQGGYPGAGNINSDPAFSDSNYILLSNSPCIDKGDSSIIYNDPEDPQNTGFAKYPSRGTLRNDIGAYGGPLTRILSNLLIGIKEISSSTPINFVLYQNYPNPFNPVTKIKFELAVTPHSPLERGQRGVMVRLAIYDIVGKEIELAVSQQLRPGTYEVEWDGSKYTSGVYFYKLIADGFSVTKKMVLVK